MNQEFYITLPSNVQYLPGDEVNTISYYKTKLNRRIEFPKGEDWRVGLAEITYTKSWFNVRNKERIEFFTKVGNIFFKEYKTPKTSAIFATTGNEGTDENIESIEVSAFIKPGYYESIESLCDVLNNNLGLIGGLCEKTPILEFDKVSHKITLYAGICGSETFFPYFGEEVEQILGLYDSTSTISMRERTRLNKRRHELNQFAKYMEINIAFEEKKYFGERCAELNAACQSLYVYSNIVDHSLVGDTNAQLLRTVEVPSDYSYAQNITLIYDQPHFIPLQTNCIDIIVLDIRDDTFQRIPFEFGRVIIKLVIKKYNSKKND